MFSYLNTLFFLAIFEPYHFSVNNYLSAKKHTRTHTRHRLHIFRQLRNINKIYVFVHTRTLSTMFRVFFATLNVSKYPFKPISQGTKCLACTDNNQKKMDFYQKKIYRKNIYDPNKFHFRRTHIITRTYGIMYG